jgi:hypothetical protein
VPTYTGDGTSGIYIFGAQLSDSASVDPYVYQPVAAPTSTAYYGPRFDYDPVTLQPKGLLIEEQRTNLLLQSEAFGTSPWANGGTAPTITADAGTSPSGDVAADRIQFPAATSYRYQNAKLVAGTVYTISVYAKSYAGSDQVFRLTVNDFAGNSADLTATGTWQRFTFTFTASSSSAVAFGLRTGTAASASDILVWGAQLEAGAFATSYIPTAASQVTRAADSVSMIGNNFARWYNVNTWTLYSEADAANPAGSGGNSAGLFNIPGASTDRISGFVGASNFPRFESVVSGTVQFGLNTTPATTAYTVYKQAFAYQVDNFAICTAAGAVSADTSGVIMTGGTSLQLGNVFSAGQLNGHIRRIAYYPRRLANSELQAITA